MKLKTCSVCLQEVRLWRSNPATCQSCDRKQQKPLKRSTEPIAKHSDKRKKENNVYLTLRKVYLDTHSVCKANLQGCTGQAVEIHHKKGRCGNLLTDIRHFLPTCHHCHHTIEMEPLRAKALGLSASRLDK